MSIRVKVDNSKIHEIPARKTHSKAMKVVGNKCGQRSADELNVEVTLGSLNHVHWWRESYLLSSSKHSPGLRSKTSSSKVTTSDRFYGVAKVMEITDNFLKVVI